MKAIHYPLLYFLCWTVDVPICVAGTAFTLEFGELSLESLAWIGAEVEGGFVVVGFPVL